MFTSSPPVAYCLGVLPPLVRDAVRLIRRNPVLSLVAVASLAIGITINTTAFSVIDGLVLRPLPVADPDTLLVIRTTSRTNLSTDDVSYDDFQDIARSATTLSGVAAFKTAGAVVGNHGETPRVESLGVVSSNYFSLLGVPATVGRVFDARDDDVSSGQPVLLSYEFWQRRYGGDPQIIGHVIRLNTQQWTIVGVLPKAFHGTQPLLPPSLWVPAATLAASGRSSGGRGDRSFSVLARLTPGNTLEQANSELQSIGRALAEQYADTNRDMTPRAAYEAQARLRNVAPAIAIGLVIASLPLVIACANVMGLLLGRAEERRREMAIRLALGGSRARIVRQLLAETSALSVLAVAASLILALWILRAVPALMPVLPVEVGLDFRIDLRTALATATLAVMATIIAGLAPALTSARTDLTPIIKGHAAGAATIGRRRISLRNVLVMGQVAVMFLLIELAGLFTTSLINATAMDPGFAPGAMAFATVAPGAAGLTRAQSEDFYQQLIARVRQQSSVIGAAYARHVPLNSLFGGGATEQVVIPGHQPPDGRAAFAIRNNSVSPGYFETMGIPLLQGRNFSDGDRAGAEPVMIINETMARTFWPQQNAVGQRVDLLPSAGSARRERRPCLIVGVVRDSKYLSLRETTPSYAFLPFAQSGAGEVTLIARANGDESVLANELRRMIKDINPELPAFDVLTRTQHMRRALFGERAAAASVAVLGAISLALAIVGIYGVVAFSVSRRTRDIGIRMALGATPARVRREVLAFGARVTGMGMTIGAVLGYLAASAFASGLYDVDQTNVAIVAAAVAITVPIALLASYVPARRAARTDPTTALRT